MQAKTISFVNVKGGCGKTSLASNLAISLMKKKKTVHALDLDPQGAMEAFLLDYEGTRPNLHHKHIPLSAMGSVPKLINNLVNECHYIVMDVAGGDIASVQGVLGYSNWLIMPTRPSKKDIAATTTLLIMLAKRGDFVANPEMNVAIVMNQCSFHPLSTLADEAVATLNQIITECGIQDRVKVLNSRFTIATAWLEADMECKSIDEMTRSKTAKQWENMLKEMGKRGIL